MIVRKRRWQLQEAKNRLSEVVRLAQSEGPQTITVRGTDAVVVVSMDEYNRSQGEQMANPSDDGSLHEWFRAWARRFDDLGIEPEFPREYRDIPGRSPLEEIR